MFYFTILSVLKDKSRYVLQRSGRLMKKHYTISVVESYRRIRLFTSIERPFQKVSVLIVIKTNILFDYGAI